MKAAAPAETETTGERVHTAAAEARIRQIVNGAAKLFDEVGYHAANMEMVAKAANMKKPTLYHYLKSKEEILLRVHQTLIDDLSLRHRERVAAGTQREELLLGIIADTLHIIASHRGYLRAFFEHFRELDPVIQMQINAKRLEYFEAVKALIAEGVEEGVYQCEDVTLTTLFLLGQVNWAYQWYVAGSFPEPEALAATLLKGFLGGIAVPGKAAPKRKK